MPDQSAATRKCKQPVQEILLSYLRAAAVPVWPGADGLTVQDILLCYPQAIAVGRVPGQQELLRLHPEWTNELVAFFAVPNKPSE